MFNGIGIRIGGNGNGGGGGSAPPALPASVTGMVRRQDLVFTGSTLTSINETVVGTVPVITNLPALGSGGGYQITEAAGGNNYVSSSYVGRAAVLSASSPNFAVCYRRNNTADTQSIVLGSTRTDEYLIAAEDGSASTAQATFGAAVTFRTDGADLPSGATRGQFWTALLDDTNVRTALFRQISSFRDPIRMFSYNSAATFCGEVEVFGFAVFTDWADADGVAAYLDYYAVNDIS